MMYIFVKSTGYGIISNTAIDTDRISLYPKID